MNHTSRKPTNQYRPGNSEFHVFTACPVCASTSTRFAGKAGKKLRYFCPSCDVHYDVSAPKSQDGREGGD